MRLAIQSLPWWCQNTNILRGGRCIFLVDLVVKGLTLFPVYLSLTVLTSKSILHPPPLVHFTFDLPDVIHRIIEINNALDDTFVDLFVNFVRQTSCHFPLNLSSNVACSSFWRIRVGDNYYSRIVKCSVVKIVSTLAQTVISSGMIGYRQPVIFNFNLNATVVNCGTMTEISDRKMWLP